MGSSLSLAIKPSSCTLTTHSYHRFTPQHHHHHHHHQHHLTHQPTTTLSTCRSTSPSLRLSRTSCPSRARSSSSPVLPAPRAWASRPPAAALRWAPTSPSPTPPAPRAG